MEDTLLLDLLESMYTINVYGKTCCTKKRETMNEDRKKKINEVFAERFASLGDAGSSMKRKFFNYHEEKI